MWCRVGGFAQFLPAALASLAVACASPEPPPPPAEPVEVVVRRAQDAFAGGDYTTAIEAYSSALEITPWNDRLRSGLVAAYAARGREAWEEGDFSGLERAEADLRTAVELAPDDRVLRRNLALILVDRANRSLDAAEAKAFREEARALDPVGAEVPVEDPLFERRLDLAFGLLERGQLDAGIYRLESLRTDYPERTEASHLYAQAHMRKGDELQQAGRYDEAGEMYDVAVAVYSAIGACTPQACDPDARLAHHNRIITRINGGHPAEARAALAEAAAQGQQFPRLERAASE